MADNYTSDKRVYVDKAGKVVDEKDPARHTLLVAAGGSIPMEKAREVGLVKEGGAAAAQPRAEQSASGEGAIDPAEESARIQETAGGADSAKASKKSSKKSAGKK